MTYIFKDLETKEDIILSGRSRPKAAGIKSFYKSFAKRGFDVVLVLLASPMAVLLVLFGAMLTAADGHNPFYSQRRVGLGGKVFRIWKLRTMVPNADEKLEAYLASDISARAEWDEHQKLSNDPRITKTGQILRKTSLDELPQLWNVLKGDMSIVGPRPMMVEQQSMYPGYAYYLHRPGITGLWQISDRHATSFRARAAYDTEYAGKISFWTDISIIWQTVAVVLRATGA